MNHQEECLKRKFPLAIVAHQIYLRLLHSGLTAEEALKLDEFKFSQFIAESCHITRDAHAVSYQGDEIPGLSFTMDGRFGIRCRGTENMVSSCFFLPVGRPDFSFFRRACRVGPRNSWAAPCAPSPPSTSRARPLPA